MNPKFCKEFKLLAAPELACGSTTFESVQEDSHCDYCDECHSWLNTQIEINRRLSAASGSIGPELAFKWKNLELDLPRRASNNFIRALQLLLVGLSIILCTALVFIHTVFPLTLNALDSMEKSLVLLSQFLAGVAGVASFRITWFRLHSKWFYTAAGVITTFLSVPPIMARNTSDTVATLCAAAALLTIGGLFSYANNLLKPLAFEPSDRSGNVIAEPVFTRLRYLLGSAMLVLIPLVVAISLSMATESYGVQLSGTTIVLSHAKVVCNRNIATNLSIFSNKHPA